jgi:hypothetical protein
MRLWQIERKAQLVWLASLEDAHTGIRQGFTSVEALFGFVRQQMGSATATSRTENEGDKPECV